MSIACHDGKINIKILKSRTIIHPPGAFDPASTGLPAPGGRFVLLSHLASGYERDGGRFSPMLITPSGALV